MAYIYIQHSTVVFGRAYKQENIENIQSKNSK